MKDETDKRQARVDQQVTAAALKGAADLLLETLGDNAALCIAVVDPDRNQRQLVMGGRCECGHHDIHLLRLLDDAQRVIMSGEPSRVTLIDPGAPERAN